MTESARGSVDAAEAVVLDELHEQRIGPDEWQGSEEYLVFENDGDAAVDMSGWVVETDSGQSYRFPDGTTVEPGEQLTLHVDADGHRYWDATGEVCRPAGRPFASRRPTASGC